MIAVTSTGVAEAAAGADEAAKAGAVAGCAVGVAAAELQERLRLRPMTNGQIWPT